MVSNQGVHRRPTDLAVAVHRPRRMISRCLIRVPDALPHAQLVCTAVVATARVLRNPGATPAKAPRGSGPTFEPGELQITDLRQGPPHRRGRGHRPRSPGPGAVVLIGPHPGPESALCRSVSHRSSSVPGRRAGPYWVRYPESGRLATQNGVGMWRTESLDSW